MSDTPTSPWLPADFTHPNRVQVAYGHHLRPIRAADVDLNMIAVMGSRERLWGIYGEPWGWPPAELTHEQDRRDLAHRADGIAAHEFFNYALLDTDGTALLGHVYIYPTNVEGADADISWWVVNECVGTDLERALDLFVPRWIAQDWPLTRPRYVRRNLTGQSGSPALNGPPWTPRHRDDGR